MKISYNWLKWYVPEIPKAEQLAEIITKHITEVEGVETLPDGDAVLDLNVLPNRAHDLLGHHGVARELSGLLGLPYTDPTPLYKTPQSKPTPLKILIETENCRRFMGRIVKNITVGPSPDWVAKHLESIGQRSINNIVDATNLVMFDSGQPTHAYDLRKIKDSELIVTSAEAGPLELLGREKQKVELLPSDLVITSGKKTLGIAGIKGGTNSGIETDTRDILLEVGNFDPVSVRKTGARLGIFSDARKRFENDLSPEHAAFGMMELSSLILEMCPEAEFEDIIDVYPKPFESRQIEFSAEYCSHRLGTTISPNDIEAIFKNYGWNYARAGTTFTLTQPSLRLDLTGAHDIAEEVGRIAGYEKVHPELPRIAFTPKINEAVYKILAARKKLVENGYSEIMTYTFTQKGEVAVLKSATDKKFLRQNLTDSLKESIVLNSKNAPLLGESEIKVFEIGTVFLRDREETRVAFGDKKSITEMTLDDFCEKNELVPSSTYPPFSQKGNSKKNSFSPWSVYPFVVRDIAVWVPEGTLEEVLVKIYTMHAGPLLYGKPTLFDTFSKNGRTSFAHRLVFQAKDRTLTDEEVNSCMSEILNILKENQDFEVR